MQFCWLLLLICWLVLGFSAKKVKQQEGIWKRFAFYWLPLLIAGFLLGPGKWFGHTWLRENFVPHTNLVGVIGIFFCISGAAIACWARILLGANWSLSVQKKEEHELIKNGIYSLVRHPIYTGLLLLFIGNAIIVGDYRAIIAVVIVLISLLYKINKEEELLTNTFGEKYSDYKSKTKKLVPFVV